MGVLAIWRYPIKAMLGQRLEAVEVGPGGCEGDRQFAVFDAATGERIANKRGPTDPRLRACRAEWHDGALRITLPGGETVSSGIENALSELLERKVRIAESEAPARGRFAATGAHHDLAPIHFITTGTLAALDADVRRFRPNLVLAFDGDEDTLLGAELRAPSGLELDVGLRRLLRRGDPPRGDRGRRPADGPAQRRSTRRGDPCRSHTSVRVAHDNRYRWSTSTF